jgi:5-methylcytosine-specific restriction enzyme subunit McrC
VRRVTLRERGRLHQSRSDRPVPPSDTLDQLWLEPHLFDRLRDDDLSRPRPVFEWQHRSARAGPWVGVVQIPGLTLELLPKIDGPHTHPETTALARDNLLAMLLESRLLPLKVRDSAALSTRSAPLLDALIALFAERALAELLRGPYRAYISEVGDLRTLRGKLLISKHIAHNAARRERFTCAYDDLSIDTPLGRVLRATCRALLTQTRAGAAQSALDRCLHLLDDVPDVPDARVWLDRIVLDRQSERFADLLIFCRLVLEQQAPSARAGATRTFSLLFDMDRVFEGFVANFLRTRVLPHLPGLQLRVQGQGARAPLLRTERNADALHLKPDLLLTARGTLEARAVLDTKWKRLGPASRHRTAKLKPNDLYQMFAYTRRYAVRRSVLLFPWTAESTDRDFAVIGPDNRPDGSQICLRYVDLRHNLRRPPGRHALAAELTAMLLRTLGLP